MYFASQHGDLETVNKILATAAANVETPDTLNNWSPLFVASFYGHKSIVDRFLEESANVEATESIFGWTPLLAAVWGGHLDVFKTLSSHSPLTVKDKNGRNALMLAVQRNHSALVNEIITHKVPDINDTDIYGRTALYMAVQLKHKEQVTKLCIAGANLEISDKDGRKPLFMAYKLGYGDIAEELVAYGANTEVLEIDTEKENGESVHPCTGKFVSYLDIAEVQSNLKVVSFCESDGQIWGGCNDGSLLVWDSYSRKLLVYLEKAQKKTIHHLVKGSNNEIWSLSGNKEVCIWKYNDGALINLCTLTKEGEINCIIRVKDEIYGGGFGDSIFSWDIHTKTCKDLKIDTSGLKLQEYERFISSMTYHQGYLYIAVLKYMLCYDTQTLTCRGVFQGHSDLITSIDAIDYQWVWTSSRDNTIRIWNKITKECVKTLQDAGGGQVTCMIVTDEDQILTGGSDGKIRSYNMKSMNWKKTFKSMHVRDISCMYWDLSKKVLWAGSLDKHVSVWK